MRRLLFVCALPFLAMAQEPQLGSIEGRVIDSSTSQPVAKARIAFAAAPGQRADAEPSSYTAVSDTAGNFRINGIWPRPNYRFTVSKPGFQKLSYGAHHADQPGQPVPVNPGEQIKDFTLAMIRLGVITGHVSDVHGDPAQGATVHLETYRYIATGDGFEKRLVPATTAIVDDLGEFRLWDIDPGKYKLSVELTGNNNAMMPTVDHSAVSPAPESYISTYYPGTADSAAATQIDVTPGANIGGISITLLKARHYRISGTVLRGGSPAAAQVSILPRGPFYGPYRNRYTFSDARGRFELADLVAGSYLVRAYFGSGNGGPSEQGLVAVDVAGGNVENLLLPVGPAINIAGRVRMADGAALPSAIRITASSRVDNSGPVAVPPKADGTFKLQVPTPGTYEPQVTNMPAGAYVKSIRAGETDVLAQGLLVGGGEAPPIEIVIGTHPGNVTGSVEGEETGKVISRATVVLMPQEKWRQGRRLYYRTAISDAGGHFTMRNVIPGDYKVLVWENLETNAYMDPDVVKPVESKALLLKVEEGGQSDVKLKAMPDVPARR